MMMVDIPKFLFNGQDCLDNAILYNFALATLGDLLQKHLEESLAQDWIHMGLQKISNILRPPPQAQDSDCNASFVISEEAKNPLKSTFHFPFLSSTKIDILPILYSNITTMRMLLGRNGGEIEKSDNRPKSKRRLFVGPFRFDCNEIVG